MNIDSDDVRDVLFSRNFLRFVESCKGWPVALLHVANLISSLQEKGEYPDNMHYDLTRFRIASAIKGGNNAYKKQQIGIFFEKYCKWAVENGQSVPVNLTVNRKRSIWKMLQLYSNEMVSSVLFNFTQDEWLMNSGHITIDWMMTTKNFEKYMGEAKQQGSAAYLMKDGL